MDCPCPHIILIDRYLFGRLLHLFVTAAEQECQMLSLLCVVVVLPDLFYHLQSTPTFTPPDCLGLLVSLPPSLSSLLPIIPLVTSFSFLPLFSDDLDRKMQGERTGEILGNSTLPVVMLSYITSKPGSRDYQKIINNGKVKVRA